MGALHLSGHAADKRDELAPSQHCMSASDASAAG
jgi:hypothetical protein